ncbi:MAG: hypothetical protein Q8Q09_08690 [Deltaproteobacteria bacterium]|nr:hypothetical protein [Deltaproteobacteria bacterium]
MKASPLRQRTQTATQTSANKAETMTTSDGGQVTRTTATNTISPVGLLQRSLLAAAACAATVIVSAPALAQAQPATNLVAPTPGGPAPPPTTGTMGATGTGGTGGTVTMTGTAGTVEQTPPTVTTTQPAAEPVPPPAVIVTPPPPPPPPPSNSQGVMRSTDFLDTRLTWTFGDDDVLQATGQRVPISGLPAIGDRSQYQLFFDALNSRFAGRENLTHLVMYARAPGFIPRVITEASLVLRFDLGQLATNSGNLTQALYDAGTYLRLLYQTNLSRPTDGLSVTFFPFDTDRFRVGYLWDLSWGGNDIFPRRVGGAPGVRFAYDSGVFSAWAGFKTAQIVVPLPVVVNSGDIEVVRVQETQYAGLAGVSIRPADIFRLDASGGFFQQGAFDFPGLRGKPAFIFGGSVRAVLNQGMPAATSIDMMLYRNHPDFPMQLFRPESYTPGRVTWNVSGELAVVDQQLADINAPGRTNYQLGLAGALQGRVKIGYLNLGATALYRDVAFLLRNVPSFIPFQTFPTDAQLTPEFFFAANADYRIPSANLTPSIIVGLQLPATFGSVVREGSLESARTLVIRRAGNFSILPPGERAIPIVSVRAAMRWDLSSIFGIIGWVQYVRDQNATLLQVDASATRQVRIFQAADQFGFGVAAQARY